MTTPPITPLTLPAVTVTALPAHPETITSRETGSRGVARDRAEKESSGEEGSGSNGEETFEVVKDRERDEGQGSGGQREGSEGVRQRRVVLDEQTE